MVGEQPGDTEDRAGRPFVGPAGGLLDKAIEEGGLTRDDVYLTNAVKHFRFVVPRRGGAVGDLAMVAGARKARAG